MKYRNLTLEDKKDYLNLLMFDEKGDQLIGKFDGVLELLVDKGYIEYDRQIIKCKLVDHYSWTHKGNVALKKYKIV